MDSQTIGDVVIDAFGKGIGFLKNHAHLPAELSQIYIGIMNIFAFYKYLPFADSSIGDSIIHAIDTAQ
jgi:hypothetical protein